MGRITVLAGAMSGVMVLVGCAPAPSPDFECVIGDEARPCNRREVARAEEDFAEVERRYRAADDDIDRMVMNPNEDVETPHLDTYSSDQFLEGGKEIGEEYRDNGWRITEPAQEESVRPKRTTGREITFLACVDGRNIETVDARSGQFLESGYVTAIEVGAELREKEWVLVSAKNVDVAQCEGLL